MPGCSLEGISASVFTEKELLWDVVDTDSDDEPTEDLSARLLDPKGSCSSLPSTRPSSPVSLSRARTPSILHSKTGSPMGSDGNSSKCLPLVGNSLPSSAAGSKFETVNLQCLALSGESHGSAGVVQTRRHLVGNVSLTLTVTARFEGATMSIDLGSSRAHEVISLPSQLLYEVPTTAEIRGHGNISGFLRIGGVPAIPFGVQTGSLKPNGVDRCNFVGCEKRQRNVISHAENLEQGNGTSVKGDGIVVESSISDTYLAEMKVIIRRAKKKELTRLAQEQRLLQAMEKKKYSSLMAQINKAKHRKVELGLIDQAARILKSISMAEGTYLNHRELTKLMRWKRVTDSSSGGSSIENCPRSAECQCNAGQAQDGEVLSITDSAVQEILKDVIVTGVEGDKWLFKALVRAAYSVPEGCVWKSGGKFILSNEERNQSASAIVSLLEREGPSVAGKGIRALVDHTEKEYGFKVTAIQLNFHPNHKTSHKQHRDIYGAGQKGGINCTCSFMKCQGTVCYSLGSSRQVLCETIQDARSKYEACSEACEGRKVYHWLSSGSAMFFNDKWNTSHTHGIPQMNDPCGPRISVALLCA